MKKIISTIALVAVLVGILPASAYAGPTWIDKDGQVNNTPWEHYVFWKTYYYAFTPDDAVIKKGMRWNADSLIWSYTYNAMATWNASRPAGMSAMVEEPVTSNADLTLFYSQCPGWPTAAGCWSISSWYLVGAWNAHFWKKSKIYMRYGYEWTTASLTGILRHEIGHALGFADQYTNWLGCNGSYYGLMDTGYIDAQGYWANCDVTVPTAAEITLWQNFWLTGWYDLYSQTLLSNGKLVLAWEDESWNDFTQHVIYQKADSQNGTYTQFTESSHIANNGSHNDVTWPYVYYLVDEIYPYQLGVNNKWIKVCREPKFNYLGYIGNLTCGPPIYYHYP